MAKSATRKALNKKYRKALQRQAAELRSMMHKGFAKRGRNRVAQGGLCKGK